MLKLGTRIALLAATLATLQLAFYLIAPNRAVPSSVRLAESLTDRRVDIIYFGDSTLYRGDPDESDPLTLPDRLNRLVPDLDFGVVAHDAFSPLLYADFARFLARQPNPPRAVIVPLNLRSFSVERDLRPEYQFARERYFLRHESAVARAFFQPLASWGIVDLRPVSEAAFANTWARDGDRRLGTVEDLSPAPGESLDDSNRKRFIELCYFFSLTPDHRQVTALDRIIDACGASGIEPLFYVTPVDVDLGDRLYDPAFRGRIAANAAFLETYIESRGATILNLTDALSHQHFALDHFPDAYLRASGKAFVAQQLFNALRSVDP